MIDWVKQRWTWFAAGLTEAVLWLANRVSGVATHRIAVGTGSGTVEAPDGTVLGRLIEQEGAARLEPASLAEALKGARVDLLVPKTWLFRRDLDPVAVHSLPFLDAFVRHHIERITPWRVGDVHYRIRQGAIADDPTRVSVAVDVVPRRLVAPSVAAIETLAPRRLRIRSMAETSADGAEITLGEGDSRLAAAARQRIVLGLCVLTVCFAGGLGWLWWQTAAVRDDIADQDRVLDERRAVLARASRQAQGGTDTDRQLRDVRDARPRIVDSIEALSMALPDSAHLTEFTLQRAQLTIVGVSTDTALLVPALERSGHFSDVTFGASTTKIENGRGDRFQLDMRIREPAPHGTAGVAP